MIKVEIACNGYASAMNALNGGADRIELFENLPDGGCTPSAGMIQKATTLSLPCYVMIRPRGGNFVYTKDEIDIMLHDIDLCKKMSVAGIVFGCLTRTGEVDTVLNKMLMEAWGNRPATFHRAIDRSSDPLKAAHAITNLGFERILSSGGAANVSEGLDTLKKMQRDIGHAIIVMPGAGVTANNAKQILDYTGCREIHATCKKTLASSNGNSRFLSETVQVSDEDEIASLVRQAGKVVE